MAIGGELGQFLKSLNESGLMTTQEVRLVLAAIPPGKRQDGKSLAQEMVRRRQLTPYQANLIQLGRVRGLVLGNYTILDKLGAGGMGVVFKAQHRVMKRVVALKVLPPVIAKNPLALKRFLREASMAAKLNHANIVKTIDADSAEGIHFIVMEYIEGTDLYHLVSKFGPLAPPEAVHCILQAARGLAHAHAAGIVHRDIKPANLILDTRGVLHIVDMGLARFEDADGDAADRITQTGTIAGTCEYMAPERMANTNQIDPRTDVYSLGCTLYYLLIGKAIYGGGTAMEKLLNHIRNPIPPLRQRRPDVTPALEALFQRMVAKKPETRYQSMNAILADLQGCLVPGSANVTPAKLRRPDGRPILGIFLKR